MGEIRLIKVAMKTFEQDPTNARARTGTFPILTRSGVIIAGHLRASAARQLGWPSIPAKDVDTGEEYDYPLTEVGQ